MAEILNNNTAKIKNKAHLANKSAKDRAQQFKNDGYYEDGGKLFCQTCNCVVNHVRKSAIIEHQQSAKHIKRKAAFDESNSTSKTVKLQRTVSSVFQSNTIKQQERIEVCHDWVNICVAANIPLSRTDHPAVRNFLLSRVRNGGSISGGHQLQENYLKDLYNIDRDILMKCLENEHVAVIFDEMSDIEGRFVFNILLSPTKINGEGNVIAYLADTIMLSKVDHVTVSQAVIRTLAAYGINFDNVSVFDTDNAVYCIKAVRTLMTLCLNAVHITCLAHVMNLVGQAFKTSFPLVTDFVMYFSRIFFNAGARKGRYLNYLSEQLEKDRADNQQKVQVTMPPNQIATRWNSWLLCVQYHFKHFLHYKGFFEAEMQHSNTPPESVEELHKMLQDVAKWQEFRACLGFLANKASITLSYMDIFQTRKPLTVKAYDHLEDL